MFKKPNQHSCFLGIAIILTLSLVLLTDSEAQSSQKLDWAKLLQAWNIYLDYPSSQNADKVSVLLPDSGHVVYTGDPKEKNTFDSIWQNLSMLQRQIWSSDRSAVKLAFRLYSIADGGFGEDLDITLGILIRINAKLFLEELLNNRPLIVRLDALVGNLGAEYVDKSNAESLEVNLRIKALEKVKDRNLTKVRDECIRALKKP